MTPPPELRPPVGDGECVESSVDAGAVGFYERCGFVRVHPAAEPSATAVPMMKWIVVAARGVSHSRHPRTRRRLRRMKTFVALLRAVNVGGTGRLPMAELRTMCEAAGFARVRTYIASGNVVFATDHDAAAVQAALEARLAAYAGRPVTVCVRTAPARSTSPTPTATTWPTPAW